LKNYVRTEVKSLAVGGAKIQPKSKPIMH